MAISQDQDISVTQRLMKLITGRNVVNKNSLKGGQSSNQLCKVGKITSDGCKLIKKTWFSPIEKLHSIKVNTNHEELNMEQEFFLSPSPISASSGSYKTTALFQNNNNCIYIAKTETYNHNILYQIKWNKNSYIILKMNEWLKIQIENNSSECNSEIIFLRDVQMNSSITAIYILTTSSSVPSLVLHSACLKSILYTISKQVLVVCSHWKTTPEWSWKTKK